VFILHHKAAEKEHLAQRTAETMWTLFSSCNNAYRQNQ